MSFGYAPKIYLRGGMPYTHIWWSRPPTFFFCSQEVGSYLRFCYIHIAFLSNYVQCCLIRIFSIHWTYDEIIMLALHLPLSLNRTP